METKNGKSEKRESPEESESFKKFDKYFIKDEKNQPLIRFTRKTSDYIPFDYENRCLGCGIPLGEMNPRQLCNKTTCPWLSPENTQDLD